YPAKRLVYMLEDSGATLLLTNSVNEPAARQITRAIPILKIGISAADTTKTPPLPGMESEKENPWNPEDDINPRKEAEADKIAYILYTSGTTGRPKGVAQTHANADYYTRNWIRKFSITAADRMTLFSSFCHDGSVQDMFSALHTGAALYPYNMKNRDITVELTQMLNEENITIWHSVPSLFSYFSNTLSQGTTYPQLRLILLGGEPVRRHEVEKLKKHYPQAKMANVYGQTESSVSAVSIMDRHYRYQKTIIGAPLDETQIIIAGEAGNPLETLEVGEIMVASRYLAPGYWQRPEDTAKVFKKHETYGKVYRTGDLGRQLADGTIEILGRRDSQVKIRGYRVEPGEIETNILEYNEISETIITLRENEDGEKYLCAYYVATEKIETSQLKDFLLETLPDYMIPLCFTRLEKMPLTPGGKIDRNALPEPATIHTRQQYTAPRNDEEKKLTRIWAQTLNIETKKIGIDNDFFQLGGHSLRAVIMVSKMHKQFNIKLPLAEIFKKNTIRTQAKTIREYTREKYEAVQPTEKKEYYNLSAAQKRLYILHQMELDGTAYNMPRIIPLKKESEPQRLEHVVAKLIQRHESLRTSFHMITPVTPGGEIPVQVVHNYKEIKFTIEEGAREHISTFFRPFDLTVAPLLRVGIITEQGAPGSTTAKHGEPQPTGKRYLLLDMHHIITDGTSMEVLTKEFFKMYAGESLPPLKLQYKDYAGWQNAVKQKETMKQQEEYWLKQYTGELPVLSLPTDYPRPAIQSFEGNRQFFKLNEEDTGTLNETAKENETTLYMTILSVFSILLSKLSGQEDVIIGTPTAGRRHADLDNIIGMFVNTLAMRNKPGGEKNIDGYLREVKGNTLSAFENQEYQFEDLVERLSVKRDTGRNPIFDVMCNQLNRTENKKQHILGTGQPEAIWLNTFTTAKFDLNLTAYEEERNINFKLEYSTRLFKTETIERYITYFKTILRAAVETPGQTISEIEIISEEERKQVLYEFNGLTTAYPHDKTIHELFGEQAAKTPDRVSITGIETQTGERKQITYKELNEKAGYEAALLRGKGVRPGTVAGIKVRRSIEMIVG
ncbi:MAG: AMP-binding protein, partial [bacterium]|nr:AMP-binding protein [bacterium]